MGHPVLSTVLSRQMDNYLQQLSANHITDFSSISLEKLNSINLSVREDTKFIFHENILISILNDVSPFYDILNINNEQIFKYRTRYYDTSNYQFYTQHQNGNKKRFKIRVREYSSVSEIFFEIKIKNNKNKTSKERFIFDGIIYNLEEDIKKMTFDTIGHSIDDLQESLIVDYDRISLVDKNLEERITIDTGLKVKNKFGAKSFDGLIIAELKQSRYNPRSNFIKALRKYKVYETRFSKYCIGLTQIDNSLKHNRFKPQLIKLDKILTHK